MWRRKRAGKRPLNLMTSVPEFQLSDGADAKLLGLGNKAEVVLVMGRGGKKRWLYVEARPRDSILRRKSVVKNKKGNHDLHNARPLNGMCSSFLLGPGINFQS
jgi:hypothetical protein